MFATLSGAPKGVYWYTSAQIAAANADPGASGPGGIYNQIRASQSSGGSSGGGGGGTAQFSAPSSSGGGDAGTFSTVNGLRTLAQMQTELANVGYNGPTDSASILSTYGRTTGQAVQPNWSPATVAAATGAAAPTTTDPLAGLAQFFAQTSGITAAQLAQQKAEFDAQLQFARDQMTQLGIPQLQINQYLAALQQQQFQATLAQNAAALTGYYVAPNLPGLSMTGGANQPQATQGAGQGTPTLAAQAQWAQLFGQNAPPTAGQQTLAAILQAAQLSGMYQGAPTEAAREFNAQNALAQGQLGQQYLSTAAQLQGPQNTFQLSNYLRGAQGNPNVPTYLQALANNMGLPSFQATGTTAPTPQSAAGIAGQLGGTQSATPGWDYNQTLGAIQNIMSRGAQALGPGSIERLTPDELAALGSGLGAVGGSLPAFLQQYAQSRVGQSAPTAMGALG